MSDETPTTADEAYAQRLEAISNVWWKRLLDVQRPYRWQLRRLGLGRTLEVGSGVGRLLKALPAGSLGIDHNPFSVKICRKQGLHSMTTEEFLASDEARPDSFDSLLMAHLMEHLSREDGLALLKEYTAYVRPGGTVCLVCPQERGYASDATHVVFYDGPDLVDVAREAGLEPGKPTSFPFPRWMGKAFIYNEIYVLARKPGT